MPPRGVPTGPGRPRKAWGPPPRCPPVPVRLRVPKRMERPQSVPTGWGGDTVGVSPCHRRDRKATTTVSLRDLGTPPGHPRKALGCPRLTPRVSGDVPCPQRFGGCPQVPADLGVTPQVSGPRPWPQRVWGQPRRFWGRPQKFWGQPQKFWGYPRRFWGRPRRFWGRPPRAFRAVPKSSLLGPSPRPAPTPHRRGSVPPQLHPPQVPGFGGRPRSRSPA